MPTAEADARGFGSAPFLAVSIAMVSVQFGAALAKTLIPVAGIGSVVALRVAIAAAVMVALVRPWRAGTVRTGRAALVAYGLSIGTMNLLFYASLRTIPLGIAVAVEFVGPLGVAVLSSRRRLDMLWSALAIAGLLVLLPVRAQAHRIDPLGLAEAFGAGLSWGCYILAGRRAGIAFGGRAAAWGLVIAACVVVPIGLFARDMPLPTAPTLLLSILGVALLSSVIPYSLELFALTRVSPRVFGILMSLEPVIAALLGAYMLHEALTPTQVGAIVLIVVASLGATLAARPMRSAVRGTDPSPIDAGTPIEA